MPVINSQALEALATQLRQKRSEEVSLSDVVRLAEISTEAIQAFFAAMDSAVLREMRDIADYITAMKREISSLQANDIKNAHIPAAGQELAAVLKATEAATNTIMNCAETVMAADADSPAAYKALVDAQMMIIFEACSFQDITGQRIAKVVETLEHIDTRVSRFAAAVRADDITGPLNEREANRAARKSRLLLHGPTRDDSNQSQIDELLAPEKPQRNSQSDIDRLFE